MKLPWKHYAKIQRARLLAAERLADRKAAHDCARMPDGTCTHRAETAWIGEQLGQRPDESRSAMILRIAFELATRPK